MSGRSSGDPHARDRGPGTTGRSARGPVLCVGVGLLLTTLTVTVFGVDLADDSVGYLLVAGAAVTLRRTPRWWLPVAPAVLAAVAREVGYGGLVGRSLEYSARWWYAADAVATLAGALTVLAVVWALPRALTWPAGVRRTAAVLAGVLALGAAVVLVAELGDGGQGVWARPEEAARAVVQALVSLLAVGLLLTPDRAFRGRTRLRRGPR